MALRATLVVMPMFVLALTNPSFYLAAIMKTVALAPAGQHPQRALGRRELVGSTLTGAAMALAVWIGLSMRPNLWMLMLWLMAVAALGRREAVRRAAHAWPPVVLERRADHDDDPARARRSRTGPTASDPYRASAIRVALFIGVTLYAWATMWVLERWRDAATPRNAASSALP